VVDQPRCGVVVLRFEFVKQAEIAEPIVREETIQKHQRLQAGSRLLASLHDIERRL
jgi:hypothetical protein